MHIHFLLIICEHTGTCSNSSMAASKVAYVGLQQQQTHVGGSSMRIRNGRSRRPDGG
jgi:hypothetical protein